MPQLGGNAGPGGGELLVAEADESDGSRARCSARGSRSSPTSSSTTTPGSAREQSARGALRRRGSRASRRTALSFWATVSTSTRCAVASRFGFDERADWRVTAFEGNGGGSRFWLRVPSAPPVRVDARAARTAQRPERRRRGRGAASPPGSSPADAAAALGELRGRGPPVRASRHGGAVSRSSTTTRTTRPRSQPRSTPPAPSRRHASSWSASSRTSTRARPRWRAGSERRSRLRTRSSSPRSTRPASSPSRA